MRRRVQRQTRGLLHALLLLALAAGSAGAQRTLRTIADDFRNGGADIWYVWTSPVRAEPRDWGGVGLAAALVVAASAVDRDVHRWMVEHPSSVVMQGIKPFREGRKLPLHDFGAGQWIQPAMGVLYVAGFLADSRGMREAAMGCASAQTAQTIMHSLALYVVKRERPLTSGNDPYDFTWGGGDQGPWSRHAFYGGHAANIMSCVSYWTERFPTGRATPALYTLAIGVGFARMADQRHWASDTAFGMLFGHAIGTTVGRRARKRAEREGDAPPVSTGMIDRAYVTGAPGGVTVGWRIDF